MGGSSHANQAKAIPDFLKLFFEYWGITPVVRDHPHFLTENWVDEPAAAGKSEPIARYVATSSAIDPSGTVGAEPSSAATVLKPLLWRTK